MTFDYNDKCQREDIESVAADHNNDNIVFYSSLDNNNVYGIDVDDGTQIVYDYKNGNVSQETVVIW